MKSNYLIIQTEKKKLRKELQDWFLIMKDHLKNIPTNIDEQVKLLGRIRKDIYEDINQIQHSAAIISAAEKLHKEFPEIDKWVWHPKQTSHKDYADLTGFVNSKIFLNAEITTSLKPVGTIDKHMSTTLKSLSRKKGKKFYFVQTGEMLSRALAKISKNKNWSIQIKKY